MAQKKKSATKRTTALEKTRPAKKKPVSRKAAQVLVIDVGGTNIKLLATGQSEPTKIPSGPDLTPKAMAVAVKKATDGWNYSKVTIGYPGVVIDGHPLLDPANLGKGWVGFDYSKAFGMPVRVINDAAMQALGSYRGGRMLFLGLGTGLGSAMVIKGVLIPLEIAHMPYKEGLTYEDFVGKRGLEKYGKRRWQKYVVEIVEYLGKVLEPSYVVLGGGNLKLLDRLPPGSLAGTNLNAFEGGFRIWRKRIPTKQSF
jgi:polyphosphate glucokinase